MITRNLTRDPRHYQIAILTGLLLFGIFELRMPVPLSAVAVALASTLGTQLVCTRLWKLPRFDARSPLISGLSLTLLLRADSLVLIALAGSIAMASKFILRRQGKHIFNPTNFGIVMLLLLTDRAWVSPGQWGSLALFAFALAGLGGLVVYRSARSDVTYAFLGSYAVLLFARAAWLGDPWTIPFHQMQNGGLLLFAFYMISDPKTTPNSRPGRIVYAACVAMGAAWVHFGLFETNGFLWSLMACALAVPWIDRVAPGELYQWASDRRPERVLDRTSASIPLTLERNPS